jgi:hypothetical protein
LAGRAAAFQCLTKDGQCNRPHRGRLASWCSSRTASRMRLRFSGDGRRTSWSVCRHGSGRFSRHNQINCRAFVSSGTLATREPHSLCTNNGKRPDGVTQVPWKRGRCLAWYATCPDTYALSHVQSSSIQAGSAASATELRKALKYSGIIAGVDFIPFVIETSGVWGQQALSLVKDIGLQIVAHEPRSTNFMRQRISVAVQRGNACCILGTFKFVGDDNQKLNS